MTTATEVDHISWSQIKSYTMCPLKHFLSRRYPPDFVPSALKFGAAIHRALAAYYEALVEGCNLTADEMLAVFHDAWAGEELPIRFAFRETQDGLFGMAERMLNVFVEQVKPGNVIAVEQAFHIEISPDVPLVSGYIDLLEERDGTLWIVDHKTSKSKPNGDLDAEQLHLYRIAAEELGFVDDDQLVACRFDALLKQKTKSDFVMVEVDTSDEDLDRVRRKAEQVWRGIEAEVVYPVRGWACSGCQWASRCEEW